MSLHIVFMGTPDFAVPSLRALVSAGYEVVGVVCQPDKPKGRSGKPAPCEVKQAALELGLPVLQFERIRKQEALDALRALKPDLFVTAAYGQILSNKVLGIPPLGTVNVHASLLPKYRGAAPINRCIMAGDTVTGVTTMFTDRGVDTGDILLSRTTPIGETETAGELTARLAKLGAELLLETLTKLENGTLTRTAQNEAEATMQGMLSKEDGRIDWNRSAREIACLVRGVDPWPGAYTPLGNGVLKIWKALPSDEEFDGACGSIVVSDKKAGLTVKCGSGSLRILELQLPGAKRLDVKSYLNGKALPVGTLLGSEAE